MKKMLLLGLAALAGTSAAFAAPRESFDLVTINAGAPINSLGLQNAAGNVILSVPVVGSDGGGSYTCQSITVSGTISTAGGGTFLREACFLVTPPTGTPFIAQPINTGASGTVPVTNSVTVAMAGAVTTAGTWTVQAFDYFDDVAAATAGAGGVLGADAQWSAASITFNDSPLAAPTLGIGPSVTATGLNSDNVAATPGATFNWNNPTAGSFNGYRVSGVVTALNTNAAANLNADLVTDTRIRVTPPGGTATVIAPVLAGSRSSATFDITIGFTTNPVGNWVVDVFENADIAGVVDNFLNSVSVELVTIPQPTSEDLGTLTAGTVVTDTETLAAGQTKWYKFTTTAPISLPMNNALEIDTVGSTAGQTVATNAGNTSMGLFDLAGTRITTDFSDGAGSLACLSYGHDNRVADPAVGTDAAGLVYNGRDGLVLAGGALPAGTYLLAVTAGDTGVTYGPSAWVVTNTSTVTGSVTTNILFKTPGITPTNPAVPTVFTNMGKVKGGLDSVEAVTTVTVTGYTAGNHIQWIQYSTSEVCSDASGRYLDIDTEGTVAGGLDTEIANYHANGVYANEDDDDGTSLLSAISYGDSTPARAAINTGLARNGRDGILPVDTYYLAVGRFNFTMPANNFNVTSSSTAAAGDIIVNFRTNLRCSIADVGKQGGITGQDKLLNNDDFVVFINLFFSSDPLADVGAQGGIDGADGQWNNDDFVVFINHFFDDAADCTG